MEKLFREELIEALLQIGDNDPIQKESDICGHILSKFTERASWVVRDTICYFCKSGCRGNYRNIQLEHEQKEIEIMFNCSLEYTLRNCAVVDGRMLSVLVAIMDVHIDEHKWCRKIPDLKTGVEDFLKCFGEFIYLAYLGCVLPRKMQAA